MKKHNFYAGPSILPSFTVKNTAEAVMNFAGTGLSIMEISHRSKEFVAVMDQASSLLKEILDIPSGYHVLFLGGGASMQFCMVPYNLLNKKAAYLNTGSWASKAQKEAHFFGEVVEVASSADKNFSYIPKNFDVPSDVDYLHITTNNTIFGTQIKNVPDLKVPLAADMSSDILSRPIDVSKFSVIYGGAQKNLGPSGVAFVIVKESALGKVEREIPTMLNYQVHIKSGSMFNTPPVLPVFSALQTLQWLKNEGGVTAMEKRNKHKANLLYEEIERNKLFKPTILNDEDRSVMNICFVMNDEYKDLENKFLEFATTKGIVGIKGHRSVGGFRASCYNALPEESVKVLIDAMQEFERKH